MESFDENTIVMLTNRGTLIVRGEELHIEKLSLDGGDLKVEGTIDSSPTRTAGGTGRAACLPGSSAEMTVSVTDQALFFAGALVMGAAVGLLYDAFRILRVRVRLPLLGGVLDLLFWLVVTVALFVYTTTAGSGEVRLYIVAAVLLGAAAYFWLLSRWFLKLGYRLAGSRWGFVACAYTTGSVSPEAV